MLKILLYGLAVFMETGISIWIFGQMFPKRKILRRNQYFSIWLLYSWVMIGAYTYPKLFVNADKVHGYLSYVIIFYLFSVFLIAILIIKNGQRNWKKIESFLFVIMCVQIECQYWNSYQSVTVILLGNIVPVLYLYIFYQCSFLEAYLWELLYLVNIGLMKEPYVAYVGTFRQRKFTEFFLWPREHFYSEIFYVITIYSVILLINKYIDISKWIKVLLIEHKKYLFVVGCTEAYILTILMNFGEGKITENNLTFTLVILIILVLCLLFVYLGMQKRLIESERNILNMRFETMKEQYGELKKSYDKYRCLLHDEKHMISYLNECLDNGNIRDARKLLEDYQELTITKNRAVYTGISSLDFMLNIKIEKIKELEIKFKADIRAEKIPMEELDFIMMLGNLLDNAIDAAAKSKEKKIVLKMKNVNDILMLKMWNTSIKIPDIKHDKFVTDKLDSEGHGWGLESVKYIVKKYEGNVRFKYSSEFFLVTVIFGEG